MIFWQRLWLCHDLELRPVKEGTWNDSRGFTDTWSSTLRELLRKSRVTWLFRTVGYEVRLDRNIREHQGRITLWYARTVEKLVITATYEDANLYHDYLTGRSVTGILHLVNQTPSYRLVLQETGYRWNGYIWFRIQRCDDRYWTNYGYAVHFAHARSTDYEFVHVRR